MLLEQNLYANQVLTDGKYTTPDTKQSIDNNIENPLFNHT
jgi:hypothetical protein